MKIQSPWMGRVRGSAGNMTGCKVYDKNVLRAKAFEVSNPNTTAQQTERSFFAQVADCCASVSDAQLRSLFGVKPKSMSRRNALTKQLSAAFTIEGTNKVLDLSKLSTIGSGKKVSTPIAKVIPGSSDPALPLNRGMFNVGEGQNPNVIVVIFDTDNNTILLENTETTIDQLEDTDDLLGNMTWDGNGYIYPTCATDGTNVYLRGFGSFIIKTRAEK